MSIIMVLEEMESLRLINDGLTTILSIQMTS
jgi:hypothetical protein